VADPGFPRSRLTKGETPVAPRSSFRTSLIALVVLVPVALAAGLLLAGRDVPGGDPAPLRPVVDSGGAVRVAWATPAPETPADRARDAAAGFGGTAALPQDSPRRTPIVAAAGRVAPSVVSITVVKTVQPRNASLLDQFFGGGGPRTQQGLGSGFAIDSDGTIVTNEHVVGGADSIVVADMQGRIHGAKLVGADALTDIAVLKIEAGVVPPAPVGTSSDLVVGEPAIAIGNPFGFYLANSEATVTSGVISGVGRTLLGGEEQGKITADLIQTDAAINPGNSGGPLVNAEGEVVGVNSAILSSSGGSEGLGFSIPIDRAIRIADELREYGRIRRPWVGVDPESVESDTSRFGMTRVRRVASGSPADKAGIRAGDVLISVAGHPVTGPLDWEVGLLDAGVGSRVDVRFRRGGQVFDDTLVVQELPSELAERVEVVRGLELVTVTPDIAVERSLPLDKGALIVSVSPAATRSSGLRAGDVIVSINRRRVESAEDADDLFRSFAGGSRIVVTVVRGGRLVNSWPFYVR
jgi:serine protease Do